MVRRLAKEGPSLRLDATSGSPKPAAKAWHGVLLHHAGDGGGGGALHFWRVHRTVIEGEGEDAVKWPAGEAVNVRVQASDATRTARPSWANPSACSSHAG